ncbi:UNVERIFIED_CONTAM: hypothetical protein Sindi_2112100, partial [Sesamum indicum]
FEAGGLCRKRCCGRGGGRISLIIAIIISRRPMWSFIAGFGGGGGNGCVGRGGDGDVK